MNCVGVVTNALRLRGLRPAQSVQEILRPPLRARIADRGYLAEIAILALARCRVIRGGVMSSQQGTWIQWRSTSQSARCRLSASMWIGLCQATCCAGC